MLIPIILVLLWIVPVVIHAVVVSRRKKGYSFSSIYIPDYKDKAGRFEFGRVVINEEPSFLSNFGMIIPGKPYYPNAHWRTHHGMIDLYAKHRYYKRVGAIMDFETGKPFPYFRPSWADRVDQWGTPEPYLQRMVDLNSKIYRDEIRKQPLQSKQPDDGQPKP